MRPRPALAAALLALLAARARGEERAPEWVRAADVAFSPESGEVPAVVLLHEREVTLEKSGRAETRERTLLRCLTAACGEFAVARVPYLKGAQSVALLKMLLVKGRERRARAGEEGPRRRGGGPGRPLR